LDGPLPVSNLVKSEVLSAEELAELDDFLKANTPKQDEGE